MVVKSKGIPQKNPLNSGLGIIAICPDGYHFSSKLHFSVSPEEILLTPSLSVDPWPITFVPGAFFLWTLFFHHLEKVIFCSKKGLTVVYPSPILMVQRKIAHFFEKGTFIGDTSTFSLNHDSGRKGNT